MNKRKVNRAWLARHLNDPYVKLAQKHGYRSRAAFKLSEIDAKDRLIRRGITVVDLGSAPGAWCQVLRERLVRPAGAGLDGRIIALDLLPMDPVADVEFIQGDFRLGSAPGAWCQVLRERLVRPAGAGLDGRIIALDLLPMDPVADVEFIQGDFREDETLERLRQALSGTKVDLVVSDMAPNLSGVASADAARMSDLLELALEFSAEHLRPEGALLAKCFHGSGYSQTVERFKTVFRQVAARKPGASRDESAETYLVGRALRGGSE